MSDRVLRVRVYVDMSAQTEGVVRDIATPTNGDDPEAHLPCVLDCEVSQSADSLNGHGVSRLRTGLLQRVEGRDASAKKRSSLDRTQFVRN